MWPIRVTHFDHVTPLYSRKQEMFEENFQSFKQFYWALIPSKISFWHFQSHDEILKRPKIQRSHVLFQILPEFVKKYVSYSQQIMTDKEAKIKVETIAKVPIILVKPTKNVIVAIFGKISRIEKRWNRENSLSDWIPV